MVSFDQSLADALATFTGVAAHAAAIEEAAALCTEVLTAGGRILVCGNGGSACEAQHLAGELVGRYKQDRPALAAIALTADGSVLSCISNDYSFADVFSRQIEALGRPGDLLIAFTTSGTSENIVRALTTARNRQLKSIAFLGRDGGRCRLLTDLPIVIAHQQTARIQEAHQFLLHCLMDRIEHRLGFA